MLHCLSSALKGAINGAVVLSRGCCKSRRKLLSPPELVFHTRMRRGFDKKDCRPGLPVAVSPASSPRLDQFAGKTRSEDKSDIHGGQGHIYLFQSISVSVSISLSF